MPKKSMSLVAIGMAFALSACGMKGGLVMPPGPAPEPVFGHAKLPTPATPAKPAPAEEPSTGKDAAR